MGDSIGASSSLALAAAIVGNAFIMEKKLDSLQIAGAEGTILIGGPIGGSEL